MRDDRTLRVVLVDDSSLVRQLLRRGLEAIGGFEIVGEAADGLTAATVIATTRPDAVTMDVLMPMRSGLETIRAVLAVQSVPIVVVADHAAGHERLVVEALAAGAVEVFPKPKQGFTEEAARALATLLRAAAKISVPVTPLPARRTTKAMVMHRQVACVGVVASTGGPRTVAQLLGALMCRNAFVAIVQHTTPGFGGAFAEWLGKELRRSVQIAHDGQLLRAGDIVVAPDGAHLELVVGGRVALVPSSPLDRMCPLGDRLLRSIASAYRGRGAGVVLTGLGSDGAEGLRSIADAGGAAFVQAATTAVVSGMPTAALHRCPTAMTGSIPELAGWISQACS